MRKYNEKTDKYYSPDATPDLYLDEETVNSVLASIEDFKGDEEVEVKNLIKEIEALHRDACLEKISLKDSKTQIKKLSDKFLEKYGFWPYLTKTFAAFYGHFDK